MAKKAFSTIKGKMLEQICSRAGNCEVNGQNWLEFELGDFSPALVNCKFDDDPIKNQRTTGPVSLT